MNRRRNYVGMCWWACVMLLLIGCSDQEWGEPQTIQTKNVVLSAQTEVSASTRFSLSQTGTFSWIKGDRIAVLQSDGTFATFDFKGATGDQKGEFSGTVSEGVTLSYAFAPDSLVSLSDDGNLQIDLPHEYERTAVVEGLEIPSHAPMMGKVDNGVVNFKNMAAVMCLYIRDITKEGCKIVVSSTDDSQLSGRFSFALNTLDTASDPVTIDHVLTNVEADRKLSYVYKPINQQDSLVNQYFFIPLPVSSAIQKYRVEIYRKAVPQDGDEPYFKKKTKGLIPLRKSLILMPSLTLPQGDNAHVAEVNDASGVNGALATAAENSSTGDTPVDATLTVTNPDSEATTVEVTEAIQIPPTITAAEPSSESSAEQPSVKITFDQLPVVSGDTAIVITDNQSQAPVPDDPEEPAPAQESKSNVVISIPQATESTTPPSFNISLPTTTVTLSATAEKATYQDITATTADNTLVVNKGVTIHNLYVRNGNVRVKGTVNSLTNLSSRVIYVFIEDEGKVRSYSDNVIVLRPGEDFGTNFANEDVADGQSVPFQIADFEQLQSLSKRVELGLVVQKSSRPYADCRYVLTKDIQVDSSVEWLPIGNNRPFRGKFDGANHRISGMLRMSMKYDRGGLFGRLQNATLQNLLVQGSVMPSDTLGVLPQLGVLCGWASGTTFINCHNEAEIKAPIAGNTSSSSWRFGGLVGVAEQCDFLACSNRGKVDEVRYWSVGGICGRAIECKLVACYQQGVFQIVSSQSAGLLCGEADAKSSLLGCWVDKGSLISSTPANYDDFAYVYDGTCDRKACFADYGSPLTSSIVQMNQAILVYGWQYTDTGSLKKLDGNSIPSNPVNPW